VIDFVDQTVRHFPETNAAGAYVDPDSGDAFWSEGAAVLAFAQQPRRAADRR
jgi:hypothetical protein